MHVAIVEDREQDAQELSAMLTQYCAQRGIVARQTRFSSAEAFLERHTPGTFALAFLDVYMDGISGMEAAQRLAACDPDCRLIFCTISHTHAVESYQVRATYYLTKPLDYALFSQAMDTACAGLLRESRCLAITSGGVALQPLLSDILYVDCAVERTRIHLAGQLLTVNETFAQVSVTLDEDGRFLCCNRNVTVNMDWVAELLDWQFLLKNGELVPIRLRGRAAVKKTFLAYSLRTLRKEDGI